MKYLPLIWYGIWRKRGRTILIIFQIVISFVLFGLLQGFKSGIEHAISKLGADVYVVSRAVGSAPLPMSLYERIKRVSGVAAVSYQSIWIGAYQKQDQHVVALAGDINLLHAVEPMGLTSAAIAKQAGMRDGALVSVELAEKYAWKIGDRVPLQSLGPGSGGQSAWAFQVVGIFDPGEAQIAKEFMIINYSFYNEARLSDKDTVQNYNVKVVDPAQGTRVAQEIDKLFVNSSEETRTESAREMAQSQLQSIGDMNFVIRAIIGAVMFALLFSIGAMMMQSFRERTPELAVLKTVGFSNQKIFLLILAEATILCLISAASGIAIAAQLVPFAKRLVNIELAMPWSVMLAGCAIAIALAITSAALPASCGLRLRVVEALAGR